MKFELLKNGDLIIVRPDGTTHGIVEIKFKGPGLGMRDLVEAKATVINRVMYVQHAINAGSLPEDN